MATGLRRQSEEFPSACLVDDPSKFHIGHSSSVPVKSFFTSVLLRMFWVGKYPSSQMYSSFALSVMGIESVLTKTVYQTYAQLIRILFCQMTAIFSYYKSFAYYFAAHTRRNLFVCSRTMLFHGHLNKAVFHTNFSLKPGADR